MGEKMQKETHFVCGICGQRIVRGESYLRHNGKPEHVGCPAARRRPKTRNLRPRGARRKRA